MGDDQSESVELTCPECSTVWNESETDDEATCPECESIVSMTDQGP